MGNTAVYAIKIAIIISALAVFVGAITTLFNLLSALSTSTVIGEVLGLISVYLPFDPTPSIAILLTSITAIVTFFIARKIYVLVVNAQGNA